MAGFSSIPLNRVLSFLDTDVTLPGSSRVQSNCSISHLHTEPTLCVSGRAIEAERRRQDILKSGLQVPGSGEVDDFDNKTRI